jgi:hypothetical protein
MRKLDVTVEELALLVRIQEILVVLLSTSRQLSG